MQYKLRYMTWSCRALFIDNNTRAIRIIRIKY